VRKTVADSGTEMFVTSPEEFARFIAEETKLWAGVLKGMAVQQQ
jgi:tripartite-type tricarboxylate transporter receptor subunit TctC